VIALFVPVMGLLLWELVAVRRAMRRDRRAKGDRR